VVKRDKSRNVFLPDLNLIFSLTRFDTAETDRILDPYRQIRGRGLQRGPEREPCNLAAG